MAFETNPNQNYHYYKRMRTCAQQRGEDSRDQNQSSTIQTLHTVTPGQNRIQNTHNQSPVHNRPRHNNTQIQPKFTNSIPDNNTVVTKHNTHGQHEFEPNTNKHTKKVTFSF